MSSTQGYQDAVVLNQIYKKPVPEGTDEDIIEKQDICVFWILKDLPGKDTDKKVSADTVK